MIPLFLVTMKVRPLSLPHCGRLTRHKELSNFARGAVRLRSLGAQQMLLVSWRFIPIFRSLPMEHSRRAERIKQSDLQEFLLHVSVLRIEWQNSVRFSPEYHDPRQMIDATCVQKNSLREPKVGQSRRHE